MRKRNTPIKAWCPHYVLYYAWWSLSDTLCSLFARLNSAVSQRVLFWFQQIIKHFPRLASGSPEGFACLKRASVWPLCGALALDPSHRVQSRVHVVVPTRADSCTSKPPLLHLGPDRQIPWTLHKSTLPLEGSRDRNLHTKATLKPIVSTPRLKCSGGFLRPFDTYILICIFSAPLDWEKWRMFLFLYSSVSNLTLQKGRGRGGYMYMLRTNRNNYSWTPG